MGAQRKPLRQHHLSVRVTFSMPVADSVAIMYVHQALGTVELIDRVVIGPVPVQTRALPLRRKHVAAALGVDPNTIYRWERDGISPVRPRRNRRTGQVIYPQDAVARLRAWMTHTTPK